MAAAGVTTKPVTLRERLRNHYTYLVQELIVSNYLNDLYEQHVFSDQDKEGLSAEGDRRRQADLFIDILKRKPEEKIQRFFDIVRAQTDKQPHIYDEIFPEERRLRSSKCTASVEADTGLRQDKDKEWDHQCLAGVKDILLPSLLLDHLREACLLTAAECEELQKGCLTEEERSRKLLHLMLPHKGKGSFTKFCDVLSNVEGQEYIAMETLKPATAAASREMATPTKSSDVSTPARAFS